MSLGLAMVSVGIATPAQAVGSFEVWISAPFIQGPDVTPDSGTVQLEEFNLSSSPPNICPTTWWLGSANEGTLEGTCVTSSPTGSGGANSTTGTPAWITGSPATRFGAAPVSSSFTVTLQQDASYLGLWWSGGDPGNEITLKKDGVEVATFTNADLLNVIYRNELGTWKANDFLYIPVYG